MTHEHLQTRSEARNCRAGGRDTPSRQTGRTDMQKENESDKLKVVPMAISVTRAHGDSCLCLCSGRCSVHAGGSSPQMVASCWLWVMVVVGERW